MTPFEEYKTYFQSLATEHPGIKSFVHGDVRRFQAKSRSEMDYPCLWLETPSQKFIDNLGNTMVESTGAFIILTNAPAGDPEAQDQIWADTNTIAFDLISRIRKDSKDRSHFLKSDFFGIDPIDTLFVANDYGWRVEFSIKKSRRLCYDENLWAPQ